MPGASFKNFTIFILLIAATGAGYFLQPKASNHHREKFPLEQLVPEKFGDWVIDPTVVPLQVSPDVQRNLDKVYEQTLSRTYINNDGVRVMLSIAYGGDQSKALQAHKPETCYVAQGFSVQNLGNSTIDFANRAIKIRKLVANYASRTEPIIYWLRVGDSTVYGGLGQTLKRLQLGASGEIPDGLLFRVSTINTDSDSAFNTQIKFTNDLLSSVKKDQLKYLIGD